jgi:DHA3 family macrolide efflux protein-like MFS transporter
MSEIEPSQATEQSALEIEPKPEVTRTPTASMRPFFIAWTGQAISLFGSQLVRFAIVWWLTVETGSDTILATATIMVILPQVILNPFAGSYVDRWNRKLTIIVSDALIAVTILGLAFLFAIDLVSLWSIIAITFIGALVGAFHNPAFSASTSMMVPKEQLSRIGGLNQALNGAITIIAPPTGALLIEILPIYWVLAIDVLTAAIAIVSIAVIHVPQPLKNSEHKKASVIKDMAEGFRFIRGWPGALRLIALAMVVNFTISPAMSLLPIVASVFFSGDVTTLAVLQSGIAIGAFTGGLFFTIWGGTKKRIHSTLAGLIFVGIGLLIIGFITPNDFWIAVAALVFVGFMVSIANGPLFAILQATIPHEMQGRVFAVLSSGATMMTPLGLAFAGPISDIFGVQMMFIIAGIVTSIAGISSFFSSSLMKFEEEHIQQLKSEDMASIDISTQDIEGTDHVKS